MAFDPVDAAKEKFKRQPRTKIRSSHTMFFSK
jgi:hypothetical protein